MRAAVNHRYGPPEVVAIENIPAPVPRPSEVLIRVAAAAVTTGDARLRAARFPRGFGLPGRLMFGIGRPRRTVLGSSFSGVVETAADGFEAGERVCGMTGMRMGAHAEYVAVPAKKVARVPEAVSDEVAAALLFGGSTALYFLRDLAGVRPGASVLINGASGAVGSLAVQLAKHLGATVTAVTSAHNAAFVTGLGADRIVDYARTPAATIPERFDVVFDTVGTLDRSSGRRLLTESGTLLLAVAALADTVRSRGNVRSGSSSENPADFAVLLDLVASAALSVPIESVHPLEDIAAAYHRVDSGRKVGNVLVRP
ncbi:NAD(P)-dependent alcohol dehydrogenase [Microbacteriaceae bacterium VKM Ac-2854]|nr:NAD(P)-dependent alcohol dehydrogenase [Microbacteriaceae bacterium VKM Ac-2854]